MSDFYDQVYSQDIAAGDASGWIQWKGTDVCIDLHCSCGESYHFDGDFLYFWRCPECGATYALGQTVKLIRLNEEQVLEVETNRPLTLHIGGADDKEAT